MIQNKYANPNIAEDFDDWVQLARENPEKFEKHRQRVIDEFLRTIPEDIKSSMQRVQWRVDQERKRSSNPTGAMVAIYRMMWEKFSILNEKQKDLLASQGKSDFQLQKIEKKATVLDFDSARIAKEIKE